MESDCNPAIVMESESDEDFVCRIKGGIGEAGHWEDVKCVSESDTSDDDDEKVTRQFEKTSPRDDRCSLRRKLRASRTDSQVSQLCEKVNRIVN